jgi:hypothetical protein
MISEVFDDEGAPEDGLIPEGSMDDTVDELRKDGFSKTIGGREIWFRRAKSGQLTALRRVQAQMVQRVRKASKSGMSKEELYEYAAKLNFDFDDYCLEFIEELIIDEADITYLTKAQLRGEIVAAEIVAVLFARDEQDDSDDPAPVAAKPAKKASVKKVANVRRTKK